MSSKNKLLFIGISFILLIFTSMLFFIIPKVEIKINENANMKVNVGDKYVEYGAQANLIGVGVKKELPVEVKGKIDTNSPGKYIITYHVEYKERSYDAIRTVYVLDLEKPKIKLNNQITICKNTNLVTIDATAIDNFDGDISEKIKYKIKDNKIIVYVLDSSNNKAEVIQDLVYNEEKPIITLNGSNSIYLIIGENYTEYGATATDTCDGNISKNINIVGNVDTNISGEYTITYKVTNSQNKTSSVNRKVYVLDKTNEEVVKNRVIYLTFDDGPGPYTEQILSILKDNDVKATFFVTNQFGSKYQYLIKKEYEAGHTVGIHTYSHKWDIYDSIDSYLNDFDKIKEIVIAQTGTEPKYIRFPGGTSNHVAKISMSNLAKLMTEKGYVYYDWNVSVEDAGSCTKKKKDVDKEKCVFNYFKEGIEKNSSNIVLMHDIKKSTLNALPNIISYAKSKGYEFKVIDDKTPIKQFIPYK